MPSYLKKFAKIRRIVQEMGEDIINSGSVSKAKNTLNHVKVPLYEKMGF